MAFRQRRRAAATIAVNDKTAAAIVYDGIQCDDEAMPAKK